MSKTISEKIITSRLGKEVTAGDIVIVPVDLCMVQDGTGPLTIKQLRKLKRGGTLSGPGRRVEEQLLPSRAKSRPPSPR